jgi:transcriptional regulator with XRE-family HTH domain
LGPVGTLGEYRGLALSPDGRRIAVPLHQSRGATSGGVFNLYQNASNGAGSDELTHYSHIGGRSSACCSSSLDSFMALWCAIAMIRSRPPLMALALRRCREVLALSQASFAAQLGVSLETYRAWDSGRRPVRLQILVRANEMALRHDPQALLPLDTLARLVHVHVRTLHAAARDGRLRVTYDTRTTFRRLRLRP